MIEFNRFGVRKQALIVALLTLMLGGCGGGGSSAEPVTPLSTKKKSLSLQSPATVLSVTKIGEVRVTRTVYDYVFAVTIQNANSAQTGVVANLITVGSGTTILDGEVVVGNLLPNATATPGDTITLRHDRLQPFNQSALQWAVTSVYIQEEINGITVPLEPDAVENSASIPGVDVNQNGIRDDIERKLATEFGLVLADYVIAVSHAKSLQSALADPSEENSARHMGLLVCVDRAILKRLRAITLATVDTPNRRLAYGNVFAGSVITDEGCAK